MNQQILIEVKVYPASFNKPHRIRLRWITERNRMVHWRGMVGKRLDEAVEFLHSHRIYPNSVAVDRKNDYLCIPSIYIDRVKKLFPLTNAEKSY